ncbi:MAG: STAS domain-containing protein [Acidimicrobiia bacterium]
MTHTLDPSTGLGGHPDDPIVLLGTVDGGAGTRIGEMLAERAAAGATCYRLDLSGVEAIDEKGLVALVRVWQEMSAAGRSLLLVDPSPAVGPLLSMTGLSATYTER